MFAVEEGGNERPWHGKGLDWRRAHQAGQPVAMLPVWRRSRGCDSMKTRTVLLLACSSRSVCFRSVLVQPIQARLARETEVLPAAAIPVAGLELLTRAVK